VNNFDRQGSARAGQRWFLYLLRNERDALYAGITTDICRRLDEHRERGTRGARYTRGCASLVLVYDCEIGSRSLALKAERRVKNLSKARKERLVSSRPDCRRLLEILDLSAAIVE